MNILTKIIITSITLLVICLFLPLIQIQKVDTVLTPASFLFGVIYGFQISLVLGNFFQLKALLSSEAGGLLAIVHLSKVIGGSFAENIEERVEHYIVENINYPVSEYVQNTYNEFFAIFEPLNTVEVEKENQKQALKYIFEGYYYLPQIRNQIQQLSPRDIEPSEWILLISLGLFLSIDLILGRQDDLFSKISAAIFATTIISSLFLLDELDSNRVQKARLDYGIFNDTLTAMGKLQYFPQFILKSHVIQLKKEVKYRIGYFPNYPSLTDRHIKEMFGKELLKKKRDTHAL
jgi:hypothetical protein